MKIWIYMLMFISLAAFASAECTITVGAKYTNAFIEEIPQLNDQLNSCQPEIPGYVKTLYKNGDFNVRVGDSKQFMLTLKSGKIISFSKEVSAKPSYTAYVSEEDFDAMLQSTDRMGTFAYLYKQKKIKIEANMFFRGVLLFVARPFISIGMNKAQVPIVLSPPQQSQDIGEYPGNRVCEFYQTNKKLVTCAAYKGGDTFCVTTIGSINAKAVKCEENGIVVCTVPCADSQLLKTCPFDNARPRGSQAAPLNFCVDNPAPQQPTKKAVGELCAHGGECQTGNCVGVGQGPPWTYRCSCNAFKYETNC